MMKGQENREMDYFLQIFGDVPVGKVALFIAAVVFLAGIYKIVEKYFREKTLREHQQSEEIQNVIDQAKKYPDWHRHSLNVQEDFKEIMQALEKNVNDLKRSNDEGMALTWRYRILRFDDEIRHDKKHTKEHFDQILEDITNYEKYCRGHPNFPNNKAVFAIKNIKNVYQQCTDEGTFL